MGIALHFFHNTNQDNENENDFSIIFYFFFKILLQSCMKFRVE